MSSTAMLSASTKLAGPRTTCTFRSQQRPRTVVIPKFSNGSCGPRGSSAYFKGRCGPFSWNVSEADQEEMRRAWKECVGNSPDAEAWEKMFSGASSRREGLDTFSLVVDVLEDDEQYVLMADVPGLTKSDIKVQISQKERTLTISGERKTAVDAQEPRAEGEAGWRIKKGERRTGKFERKFKLSDKADVESVSAKVQDGVLSMTVKKYQNGGPDVTDIPVSDY